MRVETELRDMFSYSLLPLILVVLLLIITIIILKVYKPKERKKQVITNVVVPPRKDITVIKKRYLEEIDKVLLGVNNGENKNRKAYQLLSKIVRNYIYETTNIKVQNYTLSEIEKVNMPSLYELVKEYYDPEFCKESLGNITDSIVKTREVIKKW